MKTLLPTLGLAALLGVAGCSDNMEEVKPIRVSECRSVDITRNIFYCGMPNSNTFSISGGASNYYYPADAREINYDGVTLTVVSVDAEQIKLIRKQ
jgi:hypothetical protein